MKSFIAGLVTETNSFSNIPTNTDSFRDALFVCGRSACLENPGTAATLAPQIERLEADGGEVVVSLFAFAQPSAAVIEQDYQAMRQVILDDLKAALPVDQVLLHLHGAMIAQQTWDCEGDLLEKVRQIVGPEIPVVSVLDPHAHLTERMIQNVSIMAFMKEYPHTDGPERWGEMHSAAKAIKRGDLKPVAAAVDCEILGFWPTQDQPIRGLTDKFFEAEQRSGVISTSFVHGFPWGDTPETGSKVLVYTDNDPVLAKAVARELADEVIALREASRGNLKPYQDVLAQAEQTPGLVVVSDWADNPGGGAPSDSSFILAEMLNRGMQHCAIGIFYDPELIKFCFATGEGNWLSGRIGGKLGRFSGTPINFTGKVKALKRNAMTTAAEGIPAHSIGDAALIDINGVDVLVNNLRTQLMSPSSFDALGYDITGHSCVVVKSSNHFQAAFAPIASEILWANTPGALTMDFASLQYTKLSKYRWPRDQSQNTQAICEGA